MEEFGCDSLDSVVVPTNLEELRFEGDDLSSGKAQFCFGGDGSISCAKYIESEFSVGLFRGPYKRSEALDLAAEFVDSIGLG